MTSHPLHRGCGLKSEKLRHFRISNGSPSSQRVWIEIAVWRFSPHRTQASPSSQRVWIEIEEKIRKWLVENSHPLHRGCGLKSAEFIEMFAEHMSPSSQRVWIEIHANMTFTMYRLVTLFTEGVDWNRTLKIDDVFFGMSPSSQRVWIEIDVRGGVEWWVTVTLFTEGVDWNIQIIIIMIISSCHPLHRGCGLKYREFLLFPCLTSHPLHRGCGLKFFCIFSKSLN